MKGQKDRWNEHFNFAKIIFTSQVQERVPAQLARVGASKKNRTIENAVDAGWEGTIPFVPFQSEIAYNVEIKRSRIAWSRYSGSVWSHGKKRSRGDILEGKWVLDMEISQERVGPVLATMIISDLEYHIYFSRLYPAMREELSPTWIYIYTCPLKEWLYNKEESSFIIRKFIVLLHHISQILRKPCARKSIALIKISLYLCKSFKFSKIPVINIYLQHPLQLLYMTFSCEHYQIHYCTLL